MQSYKLCMMLKNRERPESPEGITSMCYVDPNHACAVSLHKTTPNKHSKADLTKLMEYHWRNIWQHLEVPSSQM